MFHATKPSCIPSEFDEMELRICVYATVSTDEEITSEKRIIKIIPDFQWRNVCNDLLDNCPSLGL